MTQIMRLFLALPLDLLWLFGFRRLVFRFRHWELMRAMRKTALALKELSLGAAQTAEAVGRFGEAMNLYFGAREN